jgi:hypothetical protein
LKLILQWSIIFLFHFQTHMMNPPFDSNLDCDDLIIILTRFHLLSSIPLLKRIHELMIDSTFETNSDSDDRSSFWSKFSLRWFIFLLTQIQTHMIDHPFCSNFKFHRSILGLIQIQNLIIDLIFYPHSDCYDRSSIWNKFKIQIPMINPLFEAISDSYNRSFFWNKFRYWSSILLLKQVQIQIHMIDPRIETSSFSSDWSSFQTNSHSYDWSFLSQIQICMIDPPSDWISDSFRSILLSIQIQILMIDFPFEANSESYNWSCSFYPNSDCDDRSSIWIKFKFRFPWSILLLKQFQTLLIDPPFETNSDIDHWFTFETSSVSDSDSHDRSSFWNKFRLL